MIVTDLRTCQRYKTILADPPWPFKDRLPGPTRGAARHYSLMNVFDICALPVPADVNAHLWLWAPNAFVASGEASCVMVRWGFRPITLLTWKKTGRIGMGRYLRNTTEHCLFGVRGKCPPLSRSVRTDFEAPRGRHSQKPVQAYEIIEQVSPPPRIELFARARWAPRSSSSMRLRSF